MILKFEASWCTPCKALSTLLEGVSGITSVDIDSPEGLKLVAEHGVRMVPTLVSLTTGATFLNINKTKDELFAWIDENK